VLFTARFGAEFGEKCDIIGGLTGKSLRNNSSQENNTKQKVTMTPLPKNKITRAERGKRRRGNTPILTKNVKTAKNPLHKEKMVQKLMMILEPRPKVDESAAKKALAAKMMEKKGKKAPAKTAKKSDAAAKKTK